MFLSSRAIGYEEHLNLTKDFPIHHTLHLGFGGSLALQAAPRSTHSID
jgi:hypothetical protein